MPWWVHAGLLAAVLAGAGCTDIISDPPEFNASFTAESVTPDQIALAWSPGDDDLHGSDQLRYAIWVSDAGQPLNWDRTPDHLTDEGALSFNLGGLADSQAYEVLVRARDRGGNDSNNENPMLVQTPSESDADYWAVPGSGHGDLINLCAGRFLSSGDPLVGLVEERQITWYSLSPGGAMEIDQRLVVDASIQDIHVQTGMGELDDLYIVLNQTGLVRYLSDGLGGFARDSSFAVDEFPFPGTLEFADLNGDGIEDLVFATDSGLVAVYERNDSGDADMRGGVATGHTNPKLFIADIDGDGQGDVLVGSATGIDWMQWRGDFEFEPIDTLIASADLGPIEDWNLGDVDGDGMVEVLTFERDPAEALTRVEIWWNRDNGVFEDVTEVDLSGAFLTDMGAADWDTDGRVDLIFAQTRSNNAVVLRGRQSGMSSQHLAFGLVEGPDRVRQRDLNRDGRLDLVLARLASGDFSVVLSQ